MTSLSEKCAQKESQVDQLKAEYEELSAKFEGEIKQGSEKIQELKKSSMVKSETTSGVGSNK